MSPTRGQLESERVANCGKLWQIYRTWQRYIYIFNKKIYIHKSVMWIRIQGSGAGWVLMTKIEEKIHMKKNSSFLSKIAIYLSLSLLKGRPSYRT
jgi:hypothetical protein